MYAFRSRQFVGTTAIKAAGGFAPFTPRLRPRIARRSKFHGAGLADIRSTVDNNMVRLLRHFCAVTAAILRQATLHRNCPVCSLEA